jgi:FixJ family two-component response regulator
MPTVYLIAEDQDERAALTDVFRAPYWSVQDFDGLEALLRVPLVAGAACVVIVLPSGPDGAVRRLRALSRPPPVIVICARANVALAVRAMKEGAANVLEKPVDGARLLAATRAAIEEARDEIDRACAMLARLALFDTLRPRERDVVEAVVDGFGNREVAARLGIKPRTVETHRANAMTKLGARTLVDLVRIRFEVRNAMKGMRVE